LIFDLLVRFLFQSIGRNSCSIPGKGFFFFLSPSAPRSQSSPSGSHGLANPPPFLAQRSEGGFCDSSNRDVCLPILALGNAPSSSKTFSRLDYDPKRSFYFLAPSADFRVSFTSPGRFLRSQSELPPRHVPHYCPGVRGLP